MLSPAAAKHYPAAIERLAASVKVGGNSARKLKEPPLRDLIATVTVHPAEAGTDSEAAIEGHLTKMIGGDHFPTRRAWGKW